MADDPVSIFLRTLNGRGCVVEMRDHDWVFHFGDQCGIAVSAPWRIVQDGRIAFADSDHGQKFGFATPIDGALRANVLVAGRHVVNVDIDRCTADLHIHLGGDTRVDLFNHSSGYEGWQGWCSCGDGEVLSLIGMGGGAIQLYRVPAGRG